MPVWGALLGALGFNIWRHLHGKSTLCSSTRTTVSPLMFDALWLGLTLWLRGHYRRGFTSKEK